MRGGAEGGAEVPGEREPVETAQAFEFFRGDRAGGFGRQEVADASDGTKGDRTAGSCLARRRPCGVGTRGQAFGQPANDGIDGQRL